MKVFSILKRSRVPNRVSLLRLFSAVLICSMLFSPMGALAAPSDSSQPRDSKGEKVVFFASDGLRQDLVEEFADKDSMPAFSRLLKNGVKAADGGLLTQAPANTGSGWYSLATGAWPGVHGSTNNTFAINGAPFANRTGSFDAGVVQAETLAQAAERGGKKVAQIEWAGGRVGVINGPTVDYIGFFSGRGIATNYVSPTDDANFVASFG